MFTNEVNPRGVSFITFARDEASDLILTLESLKELGDRLMSPIEIVAVNDGSSDETLSNLESYSKLNRNPYLVKIINQPPLGISNAISEGLRFITYEKCIPIPGHFMFDSTGLFRLVENAYSADIVVGFRNNLRKERPLGKFLSAHALRILFRFWISKKILDPHGLIVYPTSLLKEVIDPHMEHENHIRTLSIAVGRALSIVNLPVPIRSGHKIRSKEKGRPSWPRIIHLKTGLQELYLARKYMTSRR
jgi:glycosyltransferase involved in cell wall biosynthesis